MIGANSTHVTGLILAENHTHAGKQSSMYRLVDQRMHNDKNICITVKTTQISLRASARKAMLKFCN